MKKIGFAILMACGAFGFTRSIAQTSGGQVYFLRSLNYVGSAISFNLYLDSQLVCKLPNNKYAVQNVPAGQHTVSVQNTGLGSHTKSIPMTITVVDGKANYLEIGSGSHLYLQEVTEPSAQTLMKKLSKTDKCPIKSGK
ncbi:DUF2846 domain-containing protein [Taibaiella soli]|uniref:DUF2846 domain-containing protein n=1 Tax=Taibaiella soli TaxID=1649169 RepID=A0A2W2AHD9_9BACT|nr:DUF2846 domain-containing protein [Taibaiella soli]PZF71640.1 hypothetical protein DN068_16340 [Taibaiella soli]